MFSCKKLSAFFLCLVFLSLNSTSQAFNLLKSDTDELDWTQATVLGGFVAPLKNTGLYWKLKTLRPGVQLPVRMWKAKGSSRGLYLILPGTGGDSTSGGTNFLAELVANNGYDALVFANPFSRDFQKTFSRDHLIGFPNKDIYDLVTMLEAGLNRYRQAYGNPKSIALMGSSLGGTYAVMMASHPTKFKINKYIALNPPVDFEYAIDQLDDSIRARIHTRSTAVLGIILNKVLPLFRMTAEGIARPLLGKLRQTVGDDAEVNKALIGGSFQLSLTEITKGLFETELYSSNEKRARLNATMDSITFSRYLGYAGVAIQRTQPIHGTFTSLLGNLDLRKVLRNMDDKSKVYVIHSADDFLLRRGDLADLDRQLGSRLVVFRSGGHCGISWTPGFAAALIKTIKR